jgi:hypothetical protein
MHLEQRLDLAVFDLLEIFVPEPDRAKIFRSRGADHVVGEARERAASIRSCDRHCDDQARRLRQSQRRHRGTHGRSGRQAIVDEHHVSGSDLDRRLVGAVPALAAQNLVKLAPRDFFDDRLVHAHVLHHRSIEHDATPAGDGAHGQLFVARHAELADDEHVERRAERSCYLERNRHAATGKRQHDRLAPSERQQQLRKLPTGVTAITERLIHFALLLCKHRSPNPTRSQPPVRARHRSFISMNPDCRRPVAMPLKIVLSIPSVLRTFCGPAFAVK